MKLAYLPILLIISYILTSYMLDRGYSSAAVFGMSLLVGGTLGFVTGKLKK